ncbi:hypothetical protein GmRootA79_16260 [Acidovorax sp. A79]|uniref:hypothetical protein n=1 Tax=Acidovorax sp. A79 TaxID=3056107 RepID=UPI0034E88207
MNTLHSQLVADILSQAIFSNYKTYALLGAFSLLNLLASSFFGGYWKKRGETLATKADFKTLETQLTATTRVAEEVRSAINQADWAAREWNALQRTKLEEYLLTTHELDTSFDGMRNRWIYQSDEDEAQGLDKRLSMLAALYFPMLSQATSALAHSYIQCRMSILAAGKAVNGLHKENFVGRDAQMQKFQDTWKPLYAEFHKQLSEIEQLAAQQMQLLSVGPVRKIPTSSTLAGVPT